MAALYAASRRQYLLLAVTFLVCFGFINDLRWMGLSSSSRRAMIHHPPSGTIESLKSLAAWDNSTSIEIVTNASSFPSSSPAMVSSNTTSRTHIKEDQERESVTRTAEAQATTSNDASCLMYVRIGKTGSSSLVKYFNDSLGLGQVSTICDSETGLRGLQKFSRETALDNANQVYQGHCGYGFDQYACLPTSKEPPTALIQKKTRKEVPPTFCYYYTWLREPISRVISSFIYNNRNKLPANLAQYKKCFRDDTYCPMEKGPNWHNSMTYMLGSPRNEIYRERQPINVTREHLNKAKERLEHQFVAFGLLEYSEESLEMLQSILNVISSNKKTSQKQQQAQQVHPEENNHTAMKQTLAHRNARSATDSFAARVRKELGEAIRQANLLDIELYAFARQLFLRRLEVNGTTAISRYTKDWNTTTVQLHSCPFTASVPRKVAGDKPFINPISLPNPQQPHVKGKFASAIRWPNVTKS